ncbi:hypothetical protein MRB53_038808 [Persea americana]|nr:hypothetical protein MRB53_038808 [Persea americana]
MICCPSHLTRIEPLGLESVEKQRHALFNQSSSVDRSNDVALSDVKQARTRLQQSNGCIVWYSGCRDIRHRSQSCFQSCKLQREKAHSRRGPSQCITCARQGPPRFGNFTG